MTDHFSKLYLASIKEIWQAYHLSYWLALCIHLQHCWAKITFITCFPALFLFNRSCRLLFQGRFMVLLKLLYFYWHTSKSAKQNWDSLKKIAGKAPLGNAGAIQGLLKINSIFMEIQLPAFLLMLLNRKLQQLNLKSNEATYMHKVN